MIFLTEQLSFIHFLHQCRGPFIDALAKAFNFFDSDHFAILLIAFIWFGISVKWGRRLAFLIPLDAWINYLAKMGLALPRPFHFEPSLGLVSTSTKFGCPSGGAEMAFVFGVILMKFWGRKYGRFIGALFIFLVGLSRNFLGVHFTIDVIGGWALGSIVCFTFLKLVEPVEVFARNYPTKALIATFAFAFVIMGISPQPMTVKVMKYLIIIALGSYLYKKSNLSTASSRRVVLKIALGLFGCLSVFSLYYLLEFLSIPSPIASWTTPILLGLWMSFIGHLVINKPRVFSHANS